MAIPIVVRTRQSRRSSIEIELTILQRKRQESLSFAIRCSRCDRPGPAAGREPARSCFRRLYDQLCPPAPCSWRGSRIRLRLGNVRHTSCRCLRLRCWLPPEYGETGRRSLAAMASGERTGRGRQALLVRGHDDGVEKERKVWLETGIARSARALSGDPDALRLVAQSSCLSLAGRVRRQSQAGCTVVS